ncbi:hypothetical protein AALA80_00185 [Oscillospiraceae bacterium 50-60]
MRKYFSIISDAAVFFNPGNPQGVKTRILSSATDGRGKRIWAASIWKESAAPAAKAPAAKACPIFCLPNVRKDLHFVF